MDIDRLEVGMGRQGLPVREIAADTDKYSRALPAAARIESGSVYFLKGDHWLPEYEEELIAFPIGSHDDLGLILLLFLITGLLNWRL